jgi:hypothetical protein
MSSIKRPIRKRVWSEDEVHGREVGENLRNLDSVISTAPALREVEFSDQVYQTEGFVFASSRRPHGAVVTYVEKADGSWQSVDAVPQLGFDGASVNVKIGGLTAGERYATIRLLVVG